MAAPSFRRRRCCGAHHRRTHVPDVDYEAAAEFDQKQLADLTIAIGLINAYNRMAISFRAPPACRQAIAAQLQYL